MRRVLMLIILTATWSANSQDQSSFQHQGLMEQTQQDACRELGSARCKNQGKKHANDMEKFAEYGYKAAFNYLVPGTLVKSMLSSDPNANLSKLWDFSSVTAAESIRKHTDNLWKKEAKELDLTVDECKVSTDAKAENLRREIARYNPDMALQVHCKSELKLASCNASSTETQNTAQAGGSILDIYQTTSVNEVVNNDNKITSNSLPENASDECKQGIADAKKGAKKLRQAEILKKICKATAIAGVGAVWVAQKVTNRKVSAKRGNKDRETTQVESLYAVSDLHEGKRKNAITLASVFGGVSACYAAVIAMKSSIGANITDWESITSLALSGFVAYGYGQAIGKHKDISKTAHHYAKSFPEKGACEPGSTCFCLTNAELSKKHHEIEYKKHCADSAFNDNYFCVDRHGVFDQECKCRQNNSCVNQTINNIAKKYGLSKKAAAVASRGVSRLTSGRFNNNTVQDEKNLKVAQKILKKFAKKAGLPNGLKLNKDQIGKAKAYKESGIPKNIAMVAAKVKVAKKNKNNLKETPFSLNSYKMMKRARGLKKGSNKKDNAMDFLAMFGHKKKSREPSGGVEYVTESVSMSASRQAVLDKASINYNENKPIFNIISGRYLQTPLFLFLSCCQSAWGQHPEHFES